jgi:hypothetical protein
VGGENIQTPWLGAFWSQYRNLQTQQADCSKLLFCFLLGFKYPKAMNLSSSMKNERPRSSRFLQHQHYKNKAQAHVGLGKVHHIFEIPTTVGDNPACTKGVPEVTLGMLAKSSMDADIDSYKHFYGPCPSSSLRGAKSKTRGLSVPERAARYAD